MSTLDTDRFTASVLSVLEETFGTNHQGIYIDKGTSLFETLAAIDASTASRKVGPATASIASHVAHLLFYLEVIERAMHGSAEDRIDWGQIWREARPITADEWAGLQARLRVTYDRLRDYLRAGETWNDEWAFVNALGVLAHSAYHLGAIRQAFRALA
jgi:hypothetical protein